MQVAVCRNPGQGAAGALEQARYARAKMSGRIRIMASKNKRNVGVTDIEYERIGASGSVLKDPSKRFGYVMAYLVRGTACCQIGSRCYDLVGGDVLMLSENVHCRLIHEDVASELQILQFKQHYLPEGVREHIRRTTPVIRCNEIRGVAEELLRKIEQEYSASDEHSHELLRAYLTELAVVIVRCKNSITDVADNSPAVTMAVSYIREHSAEKISLPELAKMCKVSSAYLSRRFKKEVGVGYSDYLSALRLERAEAMLREHPEMSVTEIAFFCGFNDSNYFSDKFKKQFGTSPLKFRKDGK